MTLSGDFITKIRMFYRPNEADKGVYNYFFDGEKYGVAEPAGGEGRRYAGPFTLRAQSVLIGNSLTTLYGFESAVPSGGELVYLNNPASNIGTENPYLAVVYHKDHLGSTRAITKVDGTILEQNDYYPFGLRTTMGENYSTLSESLAAIAQSANNTTANTVVPEYLYNGKEKQDFIKNSSAVINAGGSTDYTSNYIDYGARFYNPTTIRWNTQDPMAEKYYFLSMYNYCTNSPTNYIDSLGTNWYSYEDDYGETQYYYANGVLCYEDMNKLGKNPQDLGYTYIDPKTNTYYSLFGQKVQMKSGGKYNLDYLLYYHIDNLLIKNYDDKTLGKKRENFFFGIPPDKYYFNYDGSNFVSKRNTTIYRALNNRRNSEVGITRMPQPNQEEVVINGFFKYYKGYFIVFTNKLDDPKSYGFDLIQINYDWKNATALKNAMDNIFSKKVVPLKK